MQIAIRTDAHEAIGAGHLMRCLVLADHLAASGARVTFLAGRAGPMVTGALAGRTHALRVLDLPPGATAELDARASAAAIEPKTDWLLVDHYGLDHRWETALRTRVPRILAIDDLADRRHDCDVLVDPGYAREPAAYESLVPPGAELLTGSRYAILRKAFATRHDTASRWPQRRRVHVFFGSGDAAARWLACYCEWLLDAPQVAQVRAVGRGDPAQMHALAQRFPGRLEWQPHVDDMAGHMAECDLAVGAPGSATWERACVGLPSALIATAQNQVPILEALDRLRFCRYLGSAETLSAMPFAHGFAAFIEDTHTLAEIRERGVKALDGRGAERIAHRLAAHGSLQ